MKCGWIPQAGWIAVVDHGSQFAMVERFIYSSGGDYPGKASVIFYKNGPSFGLNDKGSAGSARRAG